MRKKQQQQQEVFEMLKDVGTAIVKTFGDACEVVLHDLTHPESSIIWICGNVTGRQVGGPISDLGLARLRAGDATALYNYTTHTEDGRVLKSSSVVLSDADGKQYGALCINFDVSALAACESVLVQLIARQTEHVKETFFAEAKDVLGTMVAEALAEIGKPIEVMQLADRVRLVGILERKGAFHMKRAVPLVARQLGVSRYTLYNYLNQAKQGGEASSNDKL